MRITIPHTSFVVVFGAFIVNIVAARQFSTACTFRNGTSGTKCVGLKACDRGTNIAIIGCGSCIGDYSCYEVSPFTTVGEES